MYVSYMKEGDLNIAKPESYLPILPHNILGALSDMDSSLFVLMVALEIKTDLKLRQRIRS